MSDDDAPNDDDVTPYGMDVTPHDHNIGPYILEALEPITEELHERLEVTDLSVQDWVAISTAVAKAANAGLRQAVAAITFELSLQGTTVESHGRTEDWDEWAEHYGDDGDEP